MVSFFYYGRLSSSKLGLHVEQRLVEQTAYRTEKKRPCDNGYKSVFTNPWLLRQKQVFDKRIRQKSTKRVNSLIVCSAICPGPPNRDPMDSEKRLRVYTSAATMARHEWHVDKSSAKTRKNQNAC